MQELRDGAFSARRGRMRKRRRRAADRFVLDFTGKKQEILQGFLGESL